MQYTDPTGHREVEVNGFSESCDQKLKKSKSPCPKGTKDRRDLTDWMPRVLVDSASHPGIQEIAQLHTEAKGESYYRNRIAKENKADQIFKSLVSDGKYFDVKDNVQKNLMSTKVQLGDNWYEYSTTGNILYGFYGAAAGYSSGALHLGAGFAQGLDFVRNTKSGLGGPSTYFDTSDDYYAVSFGYDLYVDYFLPDGDLSQAEFESALNNYKHRNKMAIEDAPRNCLPSSGRYSTENFYNK